MGTQVELQKISQIWRAGRLAMGDTVDGLALRLGLSRDTILSYETMILEPRTSDWFKFCQYLGVDAHSSVDLGFIDGRNKPISYPVSNSLIQDSIRREMSLKVREIIPFKASLAFEEKRLWEDFLQSMELSSDLFFIYDYRLSFEFLLALRNYCAVHDIRIYDRALSQTLVMSNHGTLSHYYQRIENPHEFLEALLEEQRHYHDIFVAEILSAGKGIEGGLLLSEESRRLFLLEDLQEFLVYKMKSFHGLLGAHTSFEGTMDFMISDQGLFFFCE